MNAYGVPVSSTKGSTLRKLFRCRVVVAADYDGARAVSPPRTVAPFVASWRPARASVDDLRTGASRRADPHRWYRHEIVRLVCCPKLELHCDVDQLALFTRMSTCSPAAPSMLTRPSILNRSTLPRVRSEIRGCVTPSRLAASDWVMPVAAM